MELWTEYEGRTIDGAYPLTKLLQPEGRSAFFSTSNGTGVPTVIRLIESHYDDDEILARWRGVAALNHANLVTMKKFGQVTVDETPLVYAVMEPVEANLGEIVSQGRLSVEETRQLATSMASALGALHGNGFVHEHVAPANVLAVGEVVKLRSDCIREAPEGEEGRALKQKDVHGLAVVLLQALTQQKTLEGAARDLPLPAPFDEIVRKGMSGEWGLREIDKALDAAMPVKNAAKVVAAAPVAAASVASVSSAGATPSLASAASQKSVPVSEPKVVAMPSAPRRVSLPVEEVDEGAGRGLGMKIGIGVVALLVLWFGWHMLVGKKTEQIEVQQMNSAPAPVLDNGAVRPEAAVVENGPAAPVKPSAVPQSPVPAATVQQQGSPAQQWRVVAFTYNHEDQAQHKAETVAESHPDLKPEVFTPTGHAPYLVTLGGPMSREDAFALSGKAKREGLPRDVYAQNYRGQGR